MDENQVSDFSGANVEPMDVNLDNEMMSKAHVNKIVTREKAKAAESARRDAEERHQRELEAIKAQSAAQSQRNSEVPRDVDANAIYQQVQERFNQEMQQRQINDEMTRVAQNYLSRIEQGRGAYEDFDTVTKDFDPTAFPQLTFLVAGIDNAADIIYDLSKNPVKLAGLDRIAERNPKQAQAELLKLSASIKENNQARADARSQNVSEPLDRMQPSRISGSNGKKTIRDLRKEPWLRG